jgi:GTP-binding protein
MKFHQVHYPASITTRAFAFFCNHPKEVKEPYRRFLENKLRQKFNFTGVPISIYLREK